ncbi:MAG: hypothetical protein JOS17DRAFT_748492, partial [Linnemannia elongata]
MDGDTYMARRGTSPVFSSPDHHRWRKEFLPWVGVHKRSLTQPSVGKLLPSDMIMDDSPVFDRTSTHPLSSPMAHPHPQHTHARLHSNNIHNNEPHPQYSLAVFKRAQQPRPRRDSHPSLSSRSTLSPSLSPEQSPSPSSISPSSMSSPTNMWSYPKGFEYRDGASTPTNNSNTTLDRRAPQQQEPRAAHARSESSTFPSFRSSSSSSSSYRHDRPAPHNEDEHRHNHQHHQQQYQQLREMERHPATSLATILNDQPGQNSSADRHSPPPPPAAQSQQRPTYFSHRPHSQSLSHIHSYPSSHHHHSQQVHQNIQQQHLQHLHKQQQQHHQQHHHQQPPQHPLSTSSSLPHDHRHPHPAHTHEHDGTGHCCDAMIEIQQLRQERDWYRSLAEKTNDGSGSDSSNSSQFNGRMISSP